MAPIPIRDFHLTGVVIVPFRVKNTVFVSPRVFKLKISPAGAFAVPPSVLSRKIYVRSV